jgi:RNase P/RNase MRP subunit POP5
MVKLIRRRYIAFRIANGVITKKDFIHNLRNAFLEVGESFYREANPWLIKFDGKKGILRCNHKLKDRVIEVLNSMKFFIQDREQLSIKVETIGTSGTIKKCTHKFYSRI